MYTQPFEINSLSGEKENQARLADRLRGEDVWDVESIGFDAQ
eukprot:COSAG02_NODE_142_length_34188_cov_183.180791_22_plen_42_part_00